MVNPLLILAVLLILFSLYLVLIHLVRKRVDRRDTES